MYSRSIKKYIRKEKARIRAAISDKQEQYRLIQELHDKIKK